MLSTEEALDLIVEHAGRQPTRAVDHTEAAGLTLAQPVASDIDSPPFTKALMDGYAVRAADLPDGQGTLTRVGMIAAGGTAERPVGPGECIQIMTGAPMPEGADAVVMIEQTNEGGEQRIRFEAPGLKPGTAVMPQGQELKKDQVVLEPGHRIGPAEVGLLATVGHTRPVVYPRPTLAVLATGDEIVPPDQSPGPGQIRNSNASTVVALAHRAGCSVRALGIARDDEADITAKIREGLTADILILSGGVSAGKRDLVPKALAAAGVQEVFHKVRFKPGKPLWFGQHAEGLVFGLPGNPVSVLVCFEVFVSTALRARQGIAAPRPTLIAARLEHAVPGAKDRVIYHPAQLNWSSEGPTVRRVDWFGSADLRALSAANALVEIPVGPPQHSPGDILNVLMLS